MRTRFCENYFLGRKRISQNLGSDFPRAGGVWGGMRAGFLGSICLVTKVRIKFTKKFGGWRGEMV